MAVKDFHQELGTLIAEIGQAKKAQAESEKRAAATQAKKVAALRQQATGSGRSGVLKSAEPMSEAGSMDGGTTHPVGDVDDGLIDVEEGAHSAENSAAIKEQIPNNVDEAEEGISVPQEERQMNVGLENTEQGADPATETESVEANRDDPGTSHPANVDESPKYGSFSLDQLRKAAAAKADEILADVAVRLGVPRAPQTQKRAGDVPEQFQTKNRGKSVPGKGQPAAQPARQQTMPAKPGTDPMAIKAALDQGVEQAAAGMVWTALEMAKEAGDFLTTYNQTLKSGVDGNPAGAAVPPDMAGDPAGGMGGGAPPPGGGGGGEQISPEMLQALMAQQGAGGAPGGDPAAGGDPAGDPSGGGGGAPGGDPAAGGAPGGDGAPPEDEAVEQLVQALEEKGIQPEELLAALQGQGDPAGGGGAPGGDPAAGGAPGGDPAAAMPAPEGMPPEKAAQFRKAAAAVRRDLQKLAGAAIVMKHTGRIRYRGAKSAAEAQLRDEVKRCIGDILGR